MKAKSMILILIALGCGLVASIGISQVMVQGGKAEAPQVETEKILVAMKLIDIAAPLDAENVKLEEWPKELIPDNTVTSMEDIKGKFSKARVVKGQAIIADLLVDEKVGIVPTIPNGYRVMALKVSVDTSVAGLLQPGDRVDITGYFRDGGKAMAKTFLYDVQVFAVNEKTERIIDPEGKALNAKTVSLLVTPEQVETVLVASSSGTLHLSLRSHSDAAPTTTAGMTLADILSDTSKRASEARKTRTDDEELPKDNFKSWLDKIKSGQGNPLAGQFVGLNASEPITMLVHTPHGITQYTWNDPKGAPQVGPYASASAPPTTPMPPQGSPPGADTVDGSSSNDEQYDEQG